MEQKKDNSFCIKKLLLQILNKTKEIYKTIKEVLKESWQIAQEETLHHVNKSENENQKKNKKGE